MHGFFLFVHTWTRARLLSSKIRASTPREAGANPAGSIRNTWSRLCIGIVIRIMGAVMSFTCEGIILTVRDSGETEQRVTLLTKTYGRITAMSRGAKHIKAKLTPQLQPGNIGFFQCIRRKRADEPLIVGADITRRGSYVARVPEKALCLLNVLQLANDFTIDRMPDDTIYMYTERIITTLARQPAVQIDALIRAYQRELLEQHGFGVSLYRCGQCGRMNKDAGIVAIAIASGIGLCGDCARQHPEPRTLRHVSKHSIDDIVRELLAYHFDIPITTFQFAGLPEFAST